MTFHLTNALIVSGLVGAILLLLQGGDRLFPMVAVITTLLQTLIVFGVMQLSLAKYRIDVILPGLLVLAAAICWSRASAKTATTAATVVLFSGVLQLLFAIDMLR